jgi:predicted branched-subunit amino acid permease
MRPIVRDALGIGVATGAYGLSFGALGVAAGLSVPPACALSVLMFTGASQFAFVGLIGGGAVAAVATALLLGARNALYGLRLAPFLRPRPLAAHLVIDESAAMAVRDTPADTRLGFWSTGAAVFVCWNLATLLGALAGATLSDPGAFGLDAAAPAGFLALLAPRLSAREPQVVAGLAAAAALVSVPLAPAGVPVLVAAAVAVIAAVGRGGEARGSGAVRAGSEAGGGAVAASGDGSRRGGSSSGRGEPVARLGGA